MEKQTSATDFVIAETFIAHDFPTSISSLIHMLANNNYSYKSLYITQECLIKILVQMSKLINDLKEKRGTFIQEATIKAIQSKHKNIDIPNETKTIISNLYDDARYCEFLIERIKDARWLSRYVGDGIAWHAFIFDRAVIRALGSKEPVGFPEETKIRQYRRIMRAVRRAESRKVLPILHDLTNCLRTDDISFVTNDQIRSIELKIIEKPRIKTVKGDRLDSRGERQKARRLRIEQYLRSGKMEKLYPSLKGGKLYTSKVPQKHNFQAISIAMSQARAKRFGLVEPEKGVLYAAFKSNEPVDNVIGDAMVRFPDIFNTLFTFPSISPRVDEYHDSFPITAMELPPEDIADILFARYGIIVFLNYRVLETVCKEQGVDLHVTRLPNGKIQLLIEGEPRIEIQQGTWDKIMLEAFSLETLIAQIKELQNIAVENNDQNKK
jgi:hypothetical protein